MIGDGTGTGSPTVRLLQLEEIPDGTAVTVNLNGLLDLNNFGETFGSLVMQGGTVSAGTATLRVNGNLTTLASSTQATITGNLSFINAMRTITVADGGALYDLNCPANISDNGFGLLFTNSPAGSSFVNLGGSNTLALLLRFY